MGEEKDITIIKSSSTSLSFLSNNQKQNNKNYIYKDIYAPPGKLYIYISDNNDSIQQQTQQQQQQPIIHSIDEIKSPLNNILKCNDIIISINDIDVVVKNKGDIIINSSSFYSSSPAEYCRNL